MEKSSLLIEGIGIGIWFTLFIVFSIKAVNQVERNSNRIHILDSDLEWWQSVRSCFKYEYK